jgi:hypothetical protein
MKSRFAFSLVASCLHLFALAPVCLGGPYAPAAGQAGSTAISKSSPAIVGWATGFQDYVIGANVDATWQTPAKALGPPVGDSFDIVCLGNAGRITLTFAEPVTDGAGFDFAVFENGFIDTFLELAYVEVSSNGSDFFRFASDSLTPGPVGGFGAVDPTNSSGLAGKYRQGFGTPFDLAELDGVSPLLDVTHVGYVRLVDIVGDGTYLDTSGDPIYDLHPTTGSGGFDLEAVAVLNAVPEPGGLALAAAALVGLCVAWRRRVLHTPNTRKHASFLASIQGASSMKRPGTKLICGLAFAALAMPLDFAAAADVDFDDLALAPGSFWNGPDPAGVDEPDPFGQPLPVKAGSFTTGGVKFGNRHNLNFGSWTGFAYSNVTDNTTPGFGNQYSAFPGTGRGPGSDNYGVAFGYDENLDPQDADQLDQLPHIELPAGWHAQSAYVTNTTYAALSMRDGDPFAKKFGGDDGTDPDWFRLTAIGTDAAGELLPAAVEFYLADFRFADPADDYIVDEWTLVDLSPLAGARRIYFNLLSSDVGQFGMNTPSFFAVDDLELALAPEPATWVLFALGALFSLSRRRRR